MDIKFNDPDELILKKDEAWGRSRTNEDDPEALENFRIAFKGVLNCALLLPDGGMPKEIFLACFEDVEKDKIEDLLAERTYISESGGKIFLKNKEQSLRIVSECDFGEQQVFLEKLWELNTPKTNPNAQEQRLYTQMAGCFAAAYNYHLTKEPEAWRFAMYAGFLYAHTVNKRATGMTKLLEAATLFQKGKNTT